MTKDAQIAVAAFYRFSKVSDPNALRAHIEDAARDHGLKGTVLVAPEGVNGTVAATLREIEGFIDWLRDEGGFPDLDAKFSTAEEMPFSRLKVRLKREIVTLGVPGIDPSRDTGTYVEPVDWNALIDDPATLVIDTRNSYEVKLGTFEGATDPETESFGELPAWVDATLDMAKDTPVAMFCTGGIRCEKSTALLKARGFTNVHHLKGGILKYLEEVPEDESRWRGECFVFDQRVSVGHGLVPGDNVLCHGCQMPVTPAEREDARYEPGVSCPHCRDGLSETQIARFRDRQRQVALERSRGRSHIAADLDTERARKRAEREAARVSAKS